MPYINMILLENRLLPYLTLLTFSGKDLSYVPSAKRCVLSFLSGGFTSMAVINPPKRKLTKRSHVNWLVL